MSPDGDNWHYLPIDDLDHNFIFPLAVGARDLLVLGTDQTVTEPRMAQLYRIGLED